MRIISKFSDYYDGVNYSDTPIWERKQIKIPLQEHRFTQKDRNDSVLSNEQLDYVKELYDSIPEIDPDYTEHTGGYQGSLYGNRVIGFCGKVYIVHRLLKKDERNLNIELHKAFIDIEKYKEEFVNLYKYKETHKHKWERRSFKFYGFGHKKGHPKTFDEWHKTYNNNKTSKLFLDLNTPLFYIHRGSLVVNPCMKDKGLHTLFDVWTVSQEIEMFLGNNLASQMDPDCILTDEGKRDAHGFNNTSFKNTSTKKPRRRKR